ncbi:23S rRNA (pseudouridine(1915)-N(3))-methyltransferase RlmH [Herbivorax sp. ANBcel31]|uniref:23S rRNA (pseudouridine(1915)-N(3))-methyltransferase RlmH n=1 Tax=Herbivorax sp. ANBcel31 TaxID=3069754 RepID=UPI0027AFA162|nr:23S rRNA (pseudouridine(1915)-N(3))-methyltransferase RlmH [Herbivorax sp. ANBcel31]MDQ2087494.1 23S rRNA (pseudouridine(1915)-N(3))-methyltransferase RlmH [Herbivorax sp. ANBcel31]
MKINIISVGKLKEKYLKEAVAEYSKRLSKFCQLDIIEVNDEKAPDKLSIVEEEQVKKREAQRIMKKIKDKTLIIVLDIKGKKMDSESFANKLNSFFISGKSNITFIIGGSLGIDDEIINLSDFRFSLSDLTFPHQLTRVILLEQIFRAFKILSNETYHK